MALQLVMDFSKKETKCPKCDFIPNFNRNWKVDYTDNCRPMQCPWEDVVITEHFHATCPECSYEIVVPCSDYGAKKGNQWSTEADAISHAVIPAVTPAVTALATTPATMTPPVRRLGVVDTLLQGTPFARQPVVDPWEVECKDCPCPSTKKDAAP